MATKYICSHCSRVAGRAGSAIVPAQVCVLCSKDYRRVREISELARRLRKVPGTPPDVMAKLFLKWAEMTGEVLAVEAIKSLTTKWAEEDVNDEAEKEARSA